jgi:hypothetical protein
MWLRVYHTAVDMAETNAGIYFREDHIRRHHFSQR